MRDHNHLHDLCRLRSTLEAFAVRRWRRGSGRERIAADLRQRLGALKRLATKGDYQAFHSSDQEFHRTAVAAAGLEPLLKSWQLVAEDLDEWILNVKQAYWPNLMALYREHELLLDAWLAEDEAVAEQATHQHLEAGWYRRRMAEGTGGEDLDPVQRAVSFIATHYASRIEWGWIARHVSFVSASHLARRFKSQTGMSPVRHLKQVRLERAAQLLLSSADSVATIARRVGYRNASHFVRDFRQMHSITPLDYRHRRKA
jgi:AraC-like DNA-binding protein